MGIILTVVFVLSFIFISVGFGIVTKRPMFRDIYVTYLNNEEYYCWYIVNDARLKQNFKLNDLNLKFVFIFIITLVITLIIRFFLLVPYIISYIYHCFRIITFKWQTAPELFVSKKIYKNNHRRNYTDLILIIFLKQPYWIGFMFAYKTFNMNNQKINIVVVKKLVKTFLSRIIFGITGWVLTFSLKIADDLCTTDGFIIQRIPECVIFNMMTIFNKNLMESRNLRIYKENGKIYFNPVKKITSTADVVMSFAKINTAHTKSKTGKLLKHYTLGTVEADGSELNADIQFTGKPITDSSYLTILTHNYKQNVSFALTNIIRESKTVYRCYDYGKLNNWGITSKEKYDSLQEIVMLKRMIEVNTKVIYEDINPFETKIYSNTSFMEVFLNQHEKHNKNLVKLYDIALNDWNSASFKDREDISLGITNIKVLNFHNRYTNIDEEISKIIKNKILVNTYKYGESIGLQWKEFDL